MGGLKAGYGEGLRSSVFVCNKTTFCSWTALPVYDRVPKIRLTSGFSDNGTAFAFTELDLFVTRDGAESFDPIATPGWGSALLDLAVLDEGKTLVAALHGPRSRSDGLYVSHDSGATWGRVRDALFSSGVTQVAVSEPRWRDARFMVAIAGNGIACSTDGVDWSTRC
jgi:hypothetical protein